MSDQNAPAALSRPDLKGPLEAEIGRLADELGHLAMLNDFSSTLVTHSANESVQKLVLMINVLLDCAHTALTSVQDALVELTVPTIPVWDGVLMVPILGTLDKQRSASLVNSVLPAVVAHRARHVILDLTGTTSFDSASATSLLQLAGALRLLGTHPILVGLRPALAKLLVGLGVELSGFQTLSTLQEALRLCLARPAP